MRIKAKEIAEALHISPATVSLALNNRQGVSPQTRQIILDYIKQKEEAQFLAQMRKPEGCKGTVLILNYIKNGVIMERNAGQPTILIEAAKEAAALAGYNSCYRVYQERTQSLDELVRDCRQWDVRGIYIMAAEMSQGDIYPFLALKVPIVTGDNLFYEAGVDSYLIDNHEGIERCVDLSLIHI